MGYGITAKAICCGNYHACVIDSSDDVRCWGQGDYGQLGYDRATNVGDSLAHAVAAAGTVDFVPPSPSPSPSSLSTASPSASHTATATASHSATPSVTPTATATAPHTVTPTVTTTATASNTATASPSRAVAAGNAVEDDSGSSTQLWAGMGVVLAIALVALAVVLSRRRRASPAAGTAHDAIPPALDEVTVQGINPQHA